MSALWYAHAAVSTLFRVVAYVFLRVIPHSSGKAVLAASFILYLLLAWLQPHSVSEDTSQVQDPSEEDTKQTDASEKTTVSAKLPPAVKPVSLTEPLQTILFSLPTSSRGLRMLNLLINTLLFVSTLEFIAYPFFDDARDVVFTRIGAVYPDAAKIVVRYPATNATTNAVRILWRQAPATSATSVEPWNDGPVANLTEDSDWITTVKLDNLWPSMSYEYQFQDVNGTLLPYPASPIRFHTFPDPLLHSGSYFRFLASSCIVPNFPYAPLQGRRIKGFDILADDVWPKKQLPTLTTSDESVSPPAQSDDTLTFTSTWAPTSSPSPTADGSHVPRSSHSALSSSAPTEFMIFMGDFIYADVPIYYGDNEEKYRRLYRRNYQSDSFRNVYERLPIFHTYDDHEIMNNYAGQANDSAPPFPNANRAFELYNAQANFDSSVEGQHYYDFRYGDAAFFVMDTRRYRSVIEETDEISRTMLGDKQLAIFYDWLATVNNTATFKFIISSVPFTSLWQFEGQIDTWAAYSYEKTALLKAMHSVPNVIVLSGDRHEFAAIEFTGEDSSHPVLEISTSPLSMFYVPIIRTLKLQSDQFVKKTKEVVHTADNGTEEVVTIVEEVPQERVLKYIWKGNHKWSSIEVDTRNDNDPTVRVDIMIDGNSAYNLALHGQPVKPDGSTAIGTYLPKRFKGVLDMIGLKPSKWF